MHMSIPSLSALVRSSALVTSFALVGSFVLVAAPAAAATYLCFGDSITFGADGSNRASYLGPMVDYLNANGEVADAINSGVRGETTAAGAARIAGELARYPQASVVLVMYGTNDIREWALGNLTPAGTQTNLATIVDRISAAGRQPILAQVAPRRSDDLDDRNNVDTERLNGVIAGVASSRGLGLARVYERLGSAVGFYTYEDSIHPGWVIAPLISEAFLAVLTGNSTIDIQGPFPVDMSPRPFSRNNPLTANVRIQVREIRSTIDTAMATLRIDGQAVTPIISGAGQDVVFTYNFPEPLDFGQSVRIEFSVPDLATPLNTTAFDYDFSVSAGNGTGGDVDGSGRIDGLDLAILASAFGAGSSSPRYLFAADIDLNGIVDGVDLSILIANFATRP